MTMDNKETDTQVTQADNHGTSEESHDWGVFETYLKISKLADELWGKPTTEPPSVSIDSQS